MKEVGLAFDPKPFLAQLSTGPGVYRMYGGGGELLYVGKARNLKKRVAQYFLRASGDPRIEAMVAQIQRIEVTLTSSEDEALLLEAALIKEQAPRYNVSLRDDKSYPYLRITATPPGPATGDAPDPKRFARIAFYRGARSGADRYFGPFPSAGAVRETLVTLQKLFRLRPCSDAFFANRQRPCLQYQIKRCSAPCVGYIDAEEYARDVERAVRLLQGRGDELARELGAEMEEASARLEFERAARLRDQIAALNRVRETRALRGGDYDAIALAPHAARSAVVVLSVRDGVNLGHASFFPRHPPGVEPAELLAGFLAQYYLERPPPAELLVGALPDDAQWLAASLTTRAGRRVRIVRPQRGARLRLLRMAEETAQQALSAHLAQSASMAQRLAELQRALALDAPPQRLECFDISHTGGEQTVASCVVFNAQGPLKSAYRRFNIDGVKPGDDYAAIQQAVARRYARIKSGEFPRPDVLFIDGGKGQLHAAQAALAELGVAGLRIVAVAKGPSRKPGLEQLIRPERDTPLSLPPDSPALHLIQQIRDEAHRFAIGGHRARRQKARLTSTLEAIEGLGAARRRALLKTLGGLPQVRRASVEELARVPGINRRLAERIYAHFR
ncbi:MAG: excinuclease ABC subunit UvrC [Sinobacteraceae bacterium]|nr:excinuclease ABC subunit UvrC [Nevskia sp.]MDI3259508.1 excinuclease ABC subunit UvrC [Nevskiaceae bacterium]